MRDDGQATIDYARCGDVPPAQSTSVNDVSPQERDVNHRTEAVQCQICTESNLIHLTHRIAVDFYTSTKTLGGLETFIQNKEFIYDFKT